MSSVTAHAATASLIALTALDIEPSQTGFVIAAVVSGGIVDLDHLVYAIRDWGMYRKQGFAGNLHHARSVFHELLGLALVGIVAALIFPAHRILAELIFIAFTVHLVEDWILGKSTPFVPVDNTLMQLFSLSLLEKVEIDILMLAVAVVLWVIYLSGGL
jgi:hypothetical protein